MFIAHLCAGGISGIVVGILVHFLGYPDWLAILGYSLGGASVALISALAWFLLDELNGKLTTSPEPRRGDPGAVKA